jgi:hypothetical protein
MLKSHTGFQRLRRCVVGRSYPAEFYSWIANTRLRNLFEKIAIETEEDFQNLIKKLNEFGVDIVRPDTLNELAFDVPAGFRIPGPYSMTPRDSLCMIGETLYQFDPIEHANRASGQISLPAHSLLSESEYNLLKGSSWPDYKQDKLDELPSWIINELKSFGIDLLSPFNNQNVLDHYYNQIRNTDFFSPVRNYVKSFGNNVITSDYLPELELLKANNITRLGYTLYFGAGASVDPASNKRLQNEFKEYNIKTVLSEGHIDGVMCPVKPGLLMSIVDPDIADYEDTFPGWEVCWLTGESWDKVKNWSELKEKTNGKWWIKGYEQDNELIDFVETWLKDWVGHVEETVFDVNALVIDEKNIIVSGYNKAAFDAFERHGVTPHIVPFRHRYFWDGGIHCNTLDLDRDGSKINYFKKDIQ